MIKMFVMLFVIFFCCISFSQERIFMPSEGDYVTVINIKRTDYSEYESFYQKVKNGSGGFQDRNSIILFGKELAFETTLDEFKILFDEFKPESEVSENVNDPIRYCVIKEHPTDPFKVTLFVQPLKIIS